MKESPVKASSFSLRRGFKADAERKSLAFREELGLHQYDPMSAEQLAKHRRIRILLPSEIPGITQELLHSLLVTGKDFWSGAIFTKDDLNYVIHNPTHSLARQQSTLMHEIAHEICGHQLKELQTALMGCVIPLRDYDHGQEAEAECLGACLQLPQKALFHYHCIKKKTVDEIAGIFNASKQMVEYRLRLSGVLKIKLPKRPF
jgi:hypothetical protein